MTRNQLRMAAVTTIAALSLGCGAGLASATEQHNVRLAHAAVQAKATVQLFEGVDAPAINEDGLDERFADLPEAPSLDQIVAAMYPDDDAAQQQALVAIADSSDEADSATDTTADGSQGAVTPQFWGWGDAWHLAKCVAAIGGFIAGNALAIAKVRKVGGVLKAAKIILKAKNANARWQALMQIFGDITGLGAVAGAC